MHTNNALPGQGFFPGYNRNANAYASVERLSALAGALPRTPGYLNKGETYRREVERGGRLCYPRGMPTPNHQRLSRLHSKRAEDAAWREHQADVDADIEGLSRDPAADRLAAEMDAAGIPIDDQIKRLKAYFVARQQGHKPKVA